MDGRVWFFGWNWNVPPALARRAVLMRPNDLFQKRADRPSAIVLGDGAIVSLDPHDARVAIGALSDRVVVCAPRTDPGLVVAWQVAGYVNVVTRELLTEAVDRCATRFARPAPPPSTWLPPDALGDPEIVAAVSVLPRLPRLCVSEWARARRVGSIARAADRPRLRPSAEGSPGPLRGRGDPLAPARRGDARGRGGGPRPQRSRLSLALPFTRPAVGCAAGRRGLRRRLTRTINARVGVRHRAPTRRGIETAPPSQSRVGDAETTVRGGT